MKLNTRIIDMRRRRAEKGVSLVEVLITLFLLTVTMVVVAHYMALSFTTTKSNKEKDFGTQKAIQMINELRAYVQGGGEEAAELLDEFDDGANFNPVLSTRLEVDSPSDELSGNWLDPEGDWRFLRKVNVEPVPNFPSDDMRLVHVKVYRADDGEPEKALADITTLVPTVGDSFWPTTQVFDVYCLAIENVPGAWVPLSKLRPLVEFSFNDIQSRNPGLEFRVHWITRLGYGRDKLYAPYLNLANGPDEQVNFIYHYPGLTNEVTQFVYYDPQQIAGRLNVDGAITHAASYALADQNNPAVRYPEEIRIRSSRPEDIEPSLRQLLDDMNMDPDQYRNSLILNFHGELIPMPPVNNVSSPAKDPGVDGISPDAYHDENRQGVRVVAHPQKLQHGNGEDVALNVFAYMTHPRINFTPVCETVLSPSNLNIMSDMIAIRIEGVLLNNTFINGNIANPDFSVALIRGGVVSDYTGLPEPNRYEYRRIETTTSNWRELSFVPPGAWMSYQVHLIHDDAGTPEDETASIICLYNTPLACPEATDGSGLPLDHRLLGQDYIPCPIGIDFGVDLTNTGDNPKNTARWIITLKDRVLPDNQRLTIQTRIIDKDVNPSDWDLLDGSGQKVNQTGGVSNHPYNLSETYTWIGSASMPPSERYQTIGDPRHNPYLDAKLDHRYNWFWIDDSDLAGDGYSNFDRCHYGFGGNEYVEFDYPRYANVFRSGILRSGSIFSNMTGYSCYFIGLGGEVGADSIFGFPNGMPVNGKPYNGNPGLYHRRDWELGTRNAEEVAGAANEKWFAMPWLGETFPDDQFLAGSVYQTNGNISSTTYRLEYWRDLDHDEFDFCKMSIRTRRTDGEGVSSFFNSVGPSGRGPFNHHFNEGSSSDIQGPGREMSGIFNYPLPEEMISGRPFDVDCGSPFPTEWDEPEYANVRNFATILSSLYQKSSKMAGSAVVSLQSSSNTEMNLTSDDCGFLLVNGLERGIFSGGPFMSRYALIGMVQSLMTAGIPGTTGRVHQLPRVEITSPGFSDTLDNPGAVPIEWDMEWQRWDGVKYLGDYPDVFSESDTLHYALKYSTDSGSTWKFMQDDSATETGVRPDASHRVTSLNYSWNVSNGAKFPSGSYVIRVEAFREDIEKHYSYHQQRLFISRN